MYTSMLFQILFPFRLLQNIGQSSLCYTVDPCGLSILNIVVCTLEKEMATHSVLFPGESQGQKSLLGCWLWGRTESGMTAVT